MNVLEIAKKVLRDEYDRALLGQSGGGSEVGTYSRYTVCAIAEAVVRLTYEQAPNIALLIEFNKQAEALKEAEEIFKVAKKIGRGTFMNKDTALEWLSKYGEKK